MRSPCASRFGTIPIFDPVRARRFLMVLRAVSAFLRSWRQKPVLQKLHFLLREKPDYARDLDFGVGSGIGNISVSGAVSALAGSYFSFENDVVVKAFSCLSFKNSRRGSRFRYKTRKQRA